MTNILPICDATTLDDDPLHSPPFILADPSRTKHSNDNSEGTVRASDWWTSGGGVETRSASERLREDDTANSERVIVQESGDALENVETDNQQRHQGYPQDKHGLKAKIAGVDSNEPHKQNVSNSSKVEIIEAEKEREAGNKLASIGSGALFSEESNPGESFSTRNNGEASRERSMLQKADAALGSLYQTQEHFFSPIRAEKHKLLKTKVGEVLDALSQMGDVRDIKQRARVSYIRGRALDVFSDFDPEAERCLARAVKLHPSEPDGWTALGHCYWKKKDLLTAKRCFLQALDKVNRAFRFHDLGPSSRARSPALTERDFQTSAPPALEKSFTLDNKRTGSRFYHNCFGTAY